MNDCNQLPVRLHKMQDQKSLTLWWYSFSGCGTNSIANGTASEGGHNLICGWLQPITAWIRQVPRQQIDDDSLTFIFGMVLEVPQYGISLRTPPVPCLSMFATNCHSGYGWCIAKNSWHSVDTHFQNGAVTMSVSLLPIKATNMMVTVPAGDSALVLINKIPK